MSFALPNSSANMNKSVYLDSYHRLNPKPESAFTSSREINLIKQVIKGEHLTKLSMLCFNSCVNNFSTEIFSSEELSCLNQCKKSGYDALTHFKG
jgi:hypothetical protein